jgi:hypothetical protein
MNLGVSGRGVNQRDAPTWTTKGLIIGESEELMKIKEQCLISTVSESVCGRGQARESSIGTNGSNHHRKR